MGEGATGYSLVFSSPSVQSQHNLFLQSCTVFRQVLRRELHILKHFPVSHKLYDRVRADHSDPVSAYVCYPSRVKRSFSGQLITTKNSGCPPRASQSTNLLKKGKHTQQKLKDRQSKLHGVAV